MEQHGRQKDQTVLYRNTAFTATVFLVGTQARKRLTKVPLHALQDHKTSSIRCLSPCELALIH